MQKNKRDWEKLFEKIHKEIQIGLNKGKPTKTIIERIKNKYKKYHKTK
jgi:hypothetical protein